MRPSLIAVHLALASSFLLHSTSGSASELYKKILTVDVNTWPDQIAEIYLNTDEANRIAGMTYIQKRRSNWQETYRRRFRSDELGSREGAILFEVSGFKIITLHVEPGFDPHRGGTIRLRYTKNAIFGTAGALRMQAVPNGSDWLVYTLANQGARTIQTIRITGGEFGIKAVRPE